MVPFWQYITFTINQMKFGLVYNSFYQFFWGKYTDFPDLRESWHVFFVFPFFARLSGIKGWGPPRHKTINMDSKKTTNRSGSLLGEFFRWKSWKNVAIISKTAFLQMLSYPPWCGHGFLWRCQVNWLSFKMSCQLQQLKCLNVLPQPRWLMFLSASPEIHLFNLFGQERHSPIWLFNCEMCGFRHP